MLLFTDHNGGLIYMKEEDYVSPFTNSSAAATSGPAPTLIDTAIQSPPIFSPMTMATTFTPFTTPSLNNIITTSSASTSTFDGTSAQSPPIFSPATMETTFTPLPTPSPMVPISSSSTAAYLEAKSSDLDSPKPIITLTNTEQLPATPTMASIHNPAPAKPEQVHKVRTVSRRGSQTTLTGEGNPSSWMVYNEYGELVTLEQQSKPIVAEELTVTQALRLVYKNYHAEFKDKMREVLTPLLDEKITNLANVVDPDPITDKKYYTDKACTWVFSPSPDPRSKQTPIAETLPEDEELHKLPVYSGPPRVLDIGCGDGRWCETIKKEHPEWIVEGVDDVDQWSSSWEGTPARDFMEPEQPHGTHQNDYFCNVHRSQARPEFTCRNINQLLLHEEPIPQNLYNLIRGRDVFDRVESYKNFLEDIRHLLQPSGVVEFVEIDPRPRCKTVGRRHSFAEHKSGPETDWTDSIADRFKDPYDAQLSTMVPNWTERVAQRLKASFRPRDGVPAAKLKGWLQGAGFWDVKQAVIPVPIGGPTASGQRLRDLMIQEIEIENSIPVLRANLPDIDQNDLIFGNFYINLHVVTCRKPRFPRPGDLLMDGTRQEMTNFEYDNDKGRKTSVKKNGFSAAVRPVMNERSTSVSWKRFSSDMVGHIVTPFSP